MKTTTIRELKHATSRVLAWAEGGETVEILRRGKAVVRIHPLPSSCSSSQPDFAGRLQQIYGPSSLALTATELIGEGRGER